PRYFPLRDEFRRLAANPQPIRAHVQSVVVSLGGMPDVDSCRRILEGVRPWAVANGVKVTLVLGVQADAAAVGALSPLLLRDGAVLIDPPGLARLLWQADLAVVNGGMTAYEAASLGLPLMMTPVAGNQVAAVKAFDDA